MLPKKMVEDYATRLWNNKDYLVIPEYFTEQTIIQSPLKKSQGIDAMHGIAKQWLQAFPDLYCSWDETISENNAVVSRWHAQGTHLGDFLEISPTKRAINYTGVTIYQLNNSKIIHYWALVDMQHLLNQLKATS